MVAGVIWKTFVTVSYSKLVWNLALIIYWFYGSVDGCMFKTRGPWATTLTWMYNYEDYIQPKYCKACKKKLTFRLPRRLLKFRRLDLIHINVRGLLKEHYCKAFVKIPKVN